MNSIVMTACGGRPLTFACLDSIKWTTDVSYELVFIDSTPAAHVAPYTMAELQKALRRVDRPLMPINYVRVENDITAGMSSIKLSELWNLGVRSCKGDRFLMAADDLIFGWHAVDHMFLALEKFNIMCGYPVHTNARMPPDFKARAKKLGAGEPCVTPVGRGNGFHGNAFSFTRKCWDLFGPFDERFTWACIDDDWNETLKWNGYEPVEVSSALIHHAGQGSVAGHMAQIDGFHNWLSTMDMMDRRKLFAKWHMGSRPAKRV